MAEYLDGKLLDMNEVHKEILTTIGNNETALVDEGIIPLVQALNNHENLRTIDSCQGSMARKSKAYVCFKYIGPLKNKADFFFQFAEAIKTRFVSDQECFQMIWGMPIPLCPLGVCPRTGNGDY